MGMRNGNGRWLSLPVAPGVRNAHGSAPLLPGRVRTREPDRDRMSGRQHGTALVRAGRQERVHLEPPLPGATRRRRRSRLRQRKSGVQVSRVRERLHPVVLQVRGRPLGLHRRLRRGAQMRPRRHAQLPRRRVPPRLRQRLRHRAGRLPAVQVLAAVRELYRLQVVRLFHRLHLARARVRFGYGAQAAQGGMFLDVGDRLPAANPVHGRKVLQGLWHQPLRAGPPGGLRSGLQSGLALPVIVAAARRRAPGRNTGRKTGRHTSSHGPFHTARRRRIFLSLANSVGPSSRRTIRAAK